MQKQVLEEGQEPITCRPADLIEDEVGKLTDEFRRLADERGIRVATDEIDDVLTYALFPQIGLKFLENRDDPTAFEPVPGTEPIVEPVVAPVAASAPSGEPEAYQVTVDGHAYNVVVAPGGEVVQAQPAAQAPKPTAPMAAARNVPAPLAGNIFKVNLTAGQTVKSGDIVMILEAMKMETEVRSPDTGTVQSVLVKEGDAVQVGDALFTLS